MNQIRIHIWIILALTLQIKDRGRSRSVIGDVLQVAAVNFKIIAIVVFVYLFGILILSLSQLILIEAS